MKFTETKLKGVYVIDLEKHKDDRGFFARSWCQKEFAEKGLDSFLVQCNISFNKKKGTLRGMHYQIAPFEEVRIVRCTQGALLDVVIDLRSGSPTYKKHFSIELSAENRKMLYIPKGFAHGFQTLMDNTEVFYQMSENYSAGHAKGVRWNDTAFTIFWPLPVTKISEKDKTYPGFL